MSKSVSFLGLGVMGYPMAGHLVKAGYDVTVFNRTTSKAEQWANEFDGKFEAIAKDAVQNSEIIFLCVGNDDDLREIMTKEDGILAGAKKDAIIVDHTTTSATVAQEMAALANDKGCEFIDAPVSGGQQGAENGQLTIMCGGEQSAFDRVVPMMDAFAKKSNLMGEIGAGQTTKMANQICIAGIIQGLSEAMLLAENAGLDLKKVVETISLGAAGSWQMVNRHETMIADEYDHGFAVDWMRKDLGICLDQARKLETSLPLTAMVDQYYQDVQKMGGGRWDTSSLFKRMQKLNKG